MTFSPSAFCVRTVSLPYVLAAVLAASQLGCRPDVASELDYNLHIKPILSDRCYKCHGPDDNARQADLRLDTRSGLEAASREDSSRSILTPGSPERSELIRRITSRDPQVRMPPPESNLALSEDEIELLGRWIAQGAEWKPHWAFLRADMPERPEVSRRDWPRNDIDYFVLARMEAAGMAPAAPATRQKLLRRASFDLTGLPPTTGELDAFLEDEEPEAFARAVDRLLAKPAYGERMAAVWLDAARYADTHGYQDDRPRTMWPWRDWVVDAFNQNLPYDSFLTWQLAGDLLPGATYEQRLATGFNRNHAITQEGGVVPEEYLAEYAADRTNTAAAAFLGLTMECARCHDHKFDPISQRDYYRLSAYFATIDEQAQISYFDLAPRPSIRMQDARLEEAAERTRRKLEAEEMRLAALVTRVPDAADVPDAAAYLDSGLVSHLPLDTLLGLATPDEGPAADMARANTGLERELNSVELVDGHAGSAARFDGVNFLNLGREADFEWYDRFSVGGWIKAPPRDTAVALFSKRNGEQKRGGYELLLTSDSRLGARLVHDGVHYAEVRTRRIALPNTWTHVFLTYDGSGLASGLRLFLDGRLARATAERDSLARRSILNGNDLLAGNWTPRMKVRADIAGFAGGAVDEVRVYRRELSAVEVARLAGRPLAEPEALRAHYRKHRDAAFRLQRSVVDSLRRSLRTIPHVMVMQESDNPRTTFVLERGAYDAPADSVGPGIPSSILPLPDAYPPNRLGLARWMTHRDNPLTSRVAANRLWQLLFGDGLVRTPEDFGSQGALPTHPGLLDYLAMTLMDYGWDTKHLLKHIMLSATYRQAAAQVDRDPDNVYLARGPSQRLSAEMIRDNALASSGLLDPAIGGEPVRPYQPAGLWKALANQIGENRYRVGRGSELYRRSLYSYWKRTIPPPAMLTFDAAERTICTVKRQSTSTPLQALVLLNDPQFIEAARVMSQNLIASVDRPLEHAFRTFTSRDPEPAEIASLEQLRTEQEAQFGKHPERAAALMGVGAHPPVQGQDPVRVAALTIALSTIMNLDEAQHR